MRLPARRITMLTPKMANAAMPSWMTSAPSNQIAMPTYELGLTSFSSVIAPITSSAIPKRMSPICHRRVVVIRVGVGAIVVLMT